MKKKRSKTLLALIIGMMLSMSMTAFAAESDPTDEQSTETTTSVESGEEAVDATADKDKAASEDKKDKEAVDAAADKDKAETVSENTTEDKDKGTDTKKDMDKGDGTGEGMTNNTIKNADQAVKTGEVDIVPVIVGLAVLAVGAGIGYVIYKKKK